MNLGQIEIQSTDFEKAVLQSDIPVAVYFYSEDCAPCLSFNPIFENASQKYKDNMKFFKIFRARNRELAEKYNIKSSPSVAFFKDGSEVCSRLSGYIGNIELRRVIEGVIQGYCVLPEREKVYCDTLILGGGPAGLSAAIYASRAKLYTVLLDESIAGGQVASTYHVWNYPGTNGVVRGIDLIENMKRQAKDFGAKIEEMKEVTEIQLTGDVKHIVTEDTEYYAKTVIIATGATPKKLPAEGEEDYRGKGVHYCATCDGALYQDADVIVVGGGNSAAEEAVFLTRYAKHVTVINIADHFKASKAEQDELFKTPGIDIIWSSEVKKINGDHFVKSVTIENVKTKEVSEISTDGIFVYIGMKPRTDVFKGILELNEKNYIKTDEDMRTNISGVFAAGDVREKRIRQIATAVGDGTIAGIMVEKFINGKGE